MDRDKNKGRQVGFDGLAMVPRHAHVIAEQRLGCRGPEQHEHLGPDAISPSNALVATTIRSCCASRLIVAGGSFGWPVYQPICS